MKAELWRSPDGRSFSLGAKPAGDWELIPTTPQSITEQGVFEIEYAASSTFNRTAYPDGGWVKWFVDELGARWCKWNETKPTWDHSFDRVIPAERVVAVLYKK